MRALLREAMEEGAFGLSRPGSTTRPAPTPRPTSWPSSRDEAARLGGFYHTHVRYALGDRFLDPFREAIEIGRRGEAPAHITHFYHRQTFPGGARARCSALVDDARAEGLDVTFDAYPYEWASTRLLILIPIWVQAGGPIATKERLADRTVRDRIREELRERGELYAGAGGLRDVRLGCVHAAGAPGAGRAGRSATLIDDRQRPGRHPVRPAARRGPPPQRGHAGAAHRRDPPLPHATRSGWSAPTRRSSATKPSARGRTAAIPRILGQFVRDEAS